MTDDELIQAAIAERKRLLNYDVQLLGHHAEVEIRIAELEAFLRVAYEFQKAAIRTEPATAVPNE